MQICRNTHICICMCIHTIFTSYRLVEDTILRTDACDRLLQISVAAIYGTLFWLASGTIDNGHDPRA